MASAPDSSSPPRIALAERTVELAWLDLPRSHRRLLESIGAAQRAIVAEPLGRYVDNLRRPAGHGRLSRPAQRDLDAAVGVWVEELRVTIVNAGHPALLDVDDRTFEAVVARIAWHEWGHALSVVRSSPQDVRDGSRLLGLAPDGVASSIRNAGYGPREYTYELVAEIYALLMARRRRGGTGCPPWLHEDLYDLVRRVSGWNP